MARTKVFVRTGAGGNVVASRVPDRGRVARVAATAVGLLVMSARIVIAERNVSFVFAPFITVLILYRGAVRENRVLLV